MLLARPDRSLACRMFTPPGSENGGGVVEIVDRFLRKGEARETLQLQQLNGERVHD